MTDEATGGKPLFCDGKKPASGRVAFVGDPPLSYLMRVMAQTHVTIPTAALTELLAAAEECARLLSERVDSDHRFHNIVPAERLVHKINSAPVRRLRAAVARVRGE